MHWEVHWFILVAARRVADNCARTPGVLSTVFSASGGTSPPAPRREVPGPGSQAGLRRGGAGEAEDDLGAARRHG